MKELTSEDSGWESGTTIVMRVVFEEPARFGPSYSCRSCGDEITLGYQEEEPAEWLGFLYFYQLILMHVDVTSQPRVSSSPPGNSGNTRRDVV